MSRVSSLFHGLLVMCLLVAGAATASTSDPQAPDAVLIKNVYVFSGKSAERGRAPVNVLVREGTIEMISAEPIEPEEGVRVLSLDGEGRTLMPGLIDAHWHSTLVRPTSVQALTSDIAYIHLLAGKVADATLMRGFTSVRDMGGRHSG